MNHSYISVEDTSYTNIDSVLTVILKGEGLREALSFIVTTGR